MQYFLKDAPSTTCVGSSHAGGTTRTGYEHCNTEPCPVWKDWEPLSNVQCSAFCGGGITEEKSFCVLAYETPVTTCSGKFFKQPHIIVYIGVKMIENTLQKIVESLRIKSVSIS